MVKIVVKTEIINKSINIAKKKKRHNLKSQIVVDKKTKKVVCTFFSNRKKHDFRLFKDRWVRLTKNRFD
jgi:hypothetical protein